MDQYEDLRAMSAGELSRLADEGSLSACQALYGRSRRLGDAGAAERYLLQGVELAAAEAQPLELRRSAFLEAGRFYQDRDGAQSLRFLEQAKELESVEACWLLLDRYSQEAADDPVCQDWIESCIRMLERKGGPGDLYRCVLRCLDEGRRSVMEGVILLNKALRRAETPELKGQISWKLWELDPSELPLPQLLAALWEAGDGAREGLLRLSRELPELPVTGQQAAHLAELWQDRGDLEQYAHWLRRAEELGSPPVRRERECPAPTDREEALAAQGRALRQDALSEAFDKIANGMMRLMVQTYSQVFRNQERLELLLVPLTQRPPGEHYAIVKREDVLKACPQHVQDRAKAEVRKNREQARPSGQGTGGQSVPGTGKKRRRRRKGRVGENEYQTYLTARRFAQLTGREAGTALFHGVDLIGWFKLNITALPGVDYQGVYQVLQEHCPGLRGTPLEEWSSLCDRARRVRNKKAHATSGELDRLGKEGLRKVLAPWLEIADLLHSEALNQSAYEEVYRALEQGEADERRLVIPFLALDRPELEHEAIRGMLEGEGVRCKADCALYSSVQALAQRLERILAGDCRWIPLDEIGRQLGDGGPSLVRTLEERGLKVENEQVFCDTEERLRALMDLIREHRPLREEAARPAGTVLPRLRALAGHREGPLTREQLQELVETHQLVLDPSVLRGAEERGFLWNEIVPCLKRARQAGRQVFLLLEATARLHLYQDCEACNEAERRPAGEREQLDRLRAGRAAYYFSRDILHQAGLLRCAGVPDPGCPDGEALWMHLRRSPSRRVCVLAGEGAGGPLLAAGGQDLPLCVVAEVSSLEGEADGMACRILPECLPLMEEAPAEILELPAGEPQAEEPSSVPERREERAGTARRAGGPLFPPDAGLRSGLGKPLPPLSRPVTAGDLLVTEQGRLVRIIGPLQDRHGNVEGGEGALYQVDVQGQAAKLYHSQQRTEDRERKLEDMLAHDPKIRNLCWPTHMLYTQRGEFAGFLMPRVPEGALTFRQSVLRLSERRVQEEILPGWDRRDLVCAALGAADLMSHLHAGNNNILMGDVNDGNFMVDPKDSSSVWLVDCDSYQFDGWPSPVGTLDYTHPNTAARLGASGDLRFGALLRQKGEEEFALSILLFRILMLGQHPFDTRGGLDRMQAMGERVFPYTGTQEDKEKVPAGNSWILWNHLTQKLKTAFLAAFRDWRAPSALEWTTLLKQYRYCIDDPKYHVTRELIPTRHRELRPDKPYFRSVVCELDQKEFDMSIKRYEETSAKRRRGIRFHFLCPDCWDRLGELERQACVLRCEQCGREFDGNARLQYLKLKLGDPIRCPRCKGLKRDWGTKRNREVKADDR